MKIKAFPTLLLVIASLALGYLAYQVAYSNSDNNDVAVSIGTGISILLTLGCVMGVSDNIKQNINLRAWGISAFVIMIAANFSFAIFGVYMPYYAIVIALLLVVHLWVAWKIFTTKEV